MIIKLDIPSEIFTDATAQLGNISLENRLKLEISKWAMEFREKQAKLAVVIKKDDLTQFADAGFGQWSL